MLRPAVLRHRPIRRRDRRSIEAMWVRRAFYGWLIPAAFLLPAVAARRLGDLQRRRLGVPVGAVPRDPVGLHRPARAHPAGPGARDGPRRARGVVVGRARVHRLALPDDRARVLRSGLVGPGHGAHGASSGSALFWLELAQLWREAKPSHILLRTTGGIGYIPAAGAPAGAVRAGRHRDHGEAARRSEPVLAGRGIHGRMDLCVLTGSASGEPAVRLRRRPRTHTSFPPVPRSTCGGRREQ